MQHISEQSLTDLPSRIQYLRDFIEFTEEDAGALRASGDILTSLVPALFDAVYKKVGSFDITAQSFVDQKTGPSEIERFQGYLLKLLTMDYSKPSSWEQLDKVGLMHTGQPVFAHRANKPLLRVEYIHCAILLGYMEDFLLNAILARKDLALDTQNALIRAINKIFWIQNDLFARHFLADNTSSEHITVKRTTVMAIMVCIFGVGLFYARAF